MAWKFYSIKNANERIDQLEAELAAAKAAPPKPGEPGKPDEKISALEKQITELASSVASLGDQLSHLESAATATSDKFQVEIARIDKSLADTTPEKIGSRIAAEITARQGQAPLNPGTTGSTNGGGADIETQLQAIADPVQRAAFFSAHKKELKLKMTRNGNGAAK